MKKILAVLLILLGLIIYMQSVNKAKEENYLGDDITVLAFGDSLTHGFGSSKSYPDYFKELTGLEIINAGVNGEISAEGVERLKDHLVFEPDLVILCHGGNDILRKLPRDELKNNLLQMVRDIKQSGAKVLLVGVPEFDMLGFDTIDVYYEVAREEEVLLEDDVIGHIVARNSLKSDYVHPNEKGYKMMAESFVKLLRDKNYIK